MYRRMLKCASRTRWSLSHVATTITLGLALTACTGTIESSGPGGRGSGSGAPGGTGTGLPPPESGFVPEVAGLRRLTIPQYRNSIRELFGDGVTVSTEFEADTALNGFASLGAARVGLSAQIVEQFEASALDVAKQVLSNAAGRSALLGCTPAGVTDDACSRQFLQKIGRRAWRRPLIEEEIVQYVGTANNAQTVLKDFFGGLEYALAGILQSPHFLYREELGTPDPAEPSRVAFNDYELATRLAFFLWNTTPDDQLLDAADAHQLTQGGLVVQSERLLGSDRASSAMQTFFSELYRLDELDSLTQLTSVYPQVTPTLGPAMRGETLRFLNDIAFGRDGDFREIFDGRSTFVNSEMAKLYGLPATAGADFVTATLPADGLRAGLLGQASFLALNSQPNRSSPTRRGKFIREMLLCQSIPAPPPNVAPFPEAVAGTAREKLTAHRQSSACSSCHLAMDPIGLGLENFDGVGALRTQDGGKDIDASGDLDGVPFAGPRELATALRNHPDSPTCLARNLYRYALAHIEGEGEEVGIAALSKTFQDSGFRFRAALRGVVNSSGFVYAAKAVE